MRLSALASLLLVAGCPMSGPGGPDADLDAGVDAAPSRDGAPADVVVTDAPLPTDAAPDVDMGPTAALDLDGVSLRLTVTLSDVVGPLFDAPTVYVWTLYLRNGPDAATADVLASASGSAYRGPAVRTGNSLTLYLNARPPEPFVCTFVERVSVGTTSLLLLDTNGDGRVDGASGTGLASIELASGDLGYSAMADATFSAVADDVAPTLAVRSEDGATQRLESLVVYASEAVPTAAWPILDLGPGHPSRALMPLDGDATAASSFTLASTDLLPFGADAHVTSSAFVDLAGNGGPLSVAVPTPPDVGLLAETGFEETMPALVIEGNARLVTSFGTLPAVSGTRSLFVGASVEHTTSGSLHGGRVLMRLAVAPSDTQVRATLRMVGFRDSSPRLFDGRVRLLSPAGDVVDVDGLATLADVGDTATGVAEYPSASDAFDVVTPLPAHVTDEVVLLVSTVTGPCGHPPLDRTNGLLVDDVRVE